MLKCGSAALTTPAEEVEAISWGPVTGSTYQIDEEAAALPTATESCGAIAKVVIGAPVAASKASRSKASEVVIRPVPASGRVRIRIQVSPDSAPDAKVRVAAPTWTVPPSRETRTEPAGGVNAGVCGPESVVVDPPTVVLMELVTRSRTVEAVPWGAAAECSVPVAGGPRLARTVRSPELWASVETTAMTVRRTRLTATEERSALAPEPPAEPVVADEERIEVAGTPSGPPTRIATPSGSVEVVLESTALMATEPTGPAPVSGSWAQPEDADPLAPATSSASPRSMATITDATTEGVAVVGTVRAEVVERPVEENCAPPVIVTARSVRAVVVWRAKVSATSDPVVRAVAVWSAETTRSPVPVRAGPEPSSARVVTVESVIALPASPLASAAASSCVREATVASCGVVRSESSPSRLSVACSTTSTTRDGASAPLAPAMERPVEVERKATSVVPGPEPSTAPRSSELEVRVRATPTARAPTSDAGPEPERACEVMLDPSFSASTARLGDSSRSRPPRWARVVRSARVTAAAAPGPSYDVASVSTEPSPLAVTDWAPPLVTRSRPLGPPSR